MDRPPEISIRRWLVEGIAYNTIYYRGPPARRNLNRAATDPATERNDGSARFPRIFIRISLFPSLRFRRLRGDDFSFFLPFFLPFSKDEFGKRRDLNRLRFSLNLFLNYYVILRRYIYILYLFWRFCNFSCNFV